jgi:hypothetical protein
VVITTILCSCIAHGIAAVLEVCLICRPMAAQWNPKVQGLCGNQTISFVALEVSGMVLDLVILMAPLGPIATLKMKKARRFKFIVLLDAGVL